MSALRPLPRVNYRSIPPFGLGGARNRADVERAVGHLLAHPEDVRPFLADLDAALVDADPDGNAVATRRELAGVFERPDRPS